MEDKELKKLERERRELEKNLGKIDVPKKIDKEDYLGMMKVLSEMEEK